MIPVFNDEGEIVAEVEYNSSLDFWDGRNNTCGSTGRHKGLTQLDTGEYVLIHGTQWEGERSSGEIVSPEVAVSEIIRSGNLELFESYPELAELRKTTIKHEKKPGGREVVICFDDKEPGLSRWVCNDCVPGCRLQGSNDPEDPPRGCPWAHNNPNDPNHARWREVPE